MSVPPSGDYSPGHVPMVFVEQEPTPTARKQTEDRGGGGVFISRGFLAILLVLSLGALGAVAWMLNERVKEESGLRRIADGQVTKLTEDNKKLTATYDDVSTRFTEADRKLKLYGKIEYQRSINDQKRAEITRLLATKPAFPAKLRIDVTDPTDLEAPAVKLLTDKYALLDKHATDIIRWAPSAPINTDPSRPNITPAPSPTPAVAPGNN